ncbi:MAG: KTSC domain-containing protein [Gemmatimonadaceae bacterium]
MPAQIKSYRGLDRLSLLAGLKCRWFSGPVCPARQSLVAPMDRIAVNSSELVSVGYDSTSCVLEVEYMTGAVYTYLDVPRSVHAELMSATSHGKYFNQYVRNAGYAYSRIR